VFDKENLIEFLLDSVYYLYMKSNPNPFFYPTVMPYKSLGKVGDNLHPNNQNNWLERKAQSP